MLKFMLSKYEHIAERSVIMIAFIAPIKHLVDPEAQDQQRRLKQLEGPPQIGVIVLEQMLSLGAVEPDRIIDEPTRAVCEREPKEPRLSLITVGLKTHLMCA